MVKGLIFLLVSFSTSVAAGAFDYAFMIEQVDDDLILSIDAVRVASIGNIGKGDDKQGIIDAALSSVDFCSSKGQWGKAIAEEAKDKINNVEYHITHLYETVEGTDIPRYATVDDERVIREAYRYGYRDPYQFGIYIIKVCLTIGF